MATAQRLIRHEAAHSSKAWTDEELMALSGDGVKVELVNGEPQMSQSTFIHGIIGARLIIELGAYVKNHNLGFVCDSSTAFWMKQGNTRAPDASFISRERFRGRALPKKYMKGAPDLVVEVVSPNDVLIDLAKKMREYFDSGARLAWVINPEDQTVVVYHSPQPDYILKAGDSLDGEEIIPGFSMPVADVFAGLAAGKKSQQKKLTRRKR
ncbi:MAG TPA: Uma2 family endonuclease [Blastocatellia bacterium]|nr:Uma2 family endonuclease [Blastocatellia bacterium]